MSFSFYQKPTYTVLTGTANFAFFGGEGAFTAAGTSTTFFRHEVVFDIAGDANALFYGERHGYQATETTIAGTSEFSPAVFALSIGAYTDTFTPTTTSFPTHTLAGGTYSVFAPYAPPVFASTALSGADYTLLSPATCEFMPIYSLSITASSTADLRAGAISTEAFSAAGSATDTLISQKLLAGLIAPVCSASGTLRTARVFPSAAAFAGLSTESYSAQPVSVSATSMAGIATHTLFAGAMHNTAWSLSGEAAATYVSASYHMASVSISSSAGLQYYIGGMVTHPFSADGVATTTSWFEQLRQGALAAAGLVLDASFASDTRLQALIYDVAYRVERVEDEFVLTAETDMVFRGQEEDNTVFTADEQLVHTYLEQPLWVRTDCITA